MSVCIDNCIDEKNEMEFNEKTMKHYMKCERQKLGYFIKNNILNCTSERLRNIFYNISEQNISIYDLFYGLYGAEHNSRMAFTTIPTLETLDLIISIAHSVATDSIEELCCGSGLFNLMLKERNKMLINRIDTVYASDGFYQLDFVESVCPDLIKIQKKDTADYLMDPNFEKDRTYIVVEPYNPMGYETTNDILDIIIRKKPRAFIVIDIDNRWSNVHGYMHFELYPDCIYLMDNISNIQEQQTDLSMNIYIRDDLMFDTKILKNYKGLTKIQNKSKQIIHQMICSNMMPSHLRDLSESKLSELINTLSESKLTSLPLYLENIDEVESYIALYNLTYNSYGSKPDGIKNREKFRILIKYLESVYVDLPSLKQNGIIPLKITNSEEAMRYLLGDYMYRSKVNNNIFAYHIKK